MTDEDKKQLIRDIDKSVTAILSGGGTRKDILLFFEDSLDDILTHIISDLPKNILTAYCRDYKGFYTLIKILEELALVTETINHEQKETPFPQMYEQRALEIQHLLMDYLNELRGLCKDEGISDEQSLGRMSMFLKDFVSATAACMETHIPGGAAFLYAEMEKEAKSGIKQAVHSFGSHVSDTLSFSEVKKDDSPAAMHYLGQQLSTTLFKELCELPLALQTFDMPLRAIETLLINIVRQKYSNPHDILDQFTEQAHQSLADIQSRFKD